MSLNHSFELKWQARGRSAPGRLEVLEDVFSPELGNQRDVLVYLPAGYDGATAGYPVLYMHDGQNLFDPATSFAGEWGVDSALERASRNAIVIGIPNMGVDRMREYSPFEDVQHGGGDGARYVDFLLNTLKPLVDTRYRTRPGAQDTLIAGSSLGGLISLYAFFRAPASFGAVGVMSPALWFADASIFPWMESAGYPGGRVYLDVGTREGQGTLANARAMRDLLVRKGYQLDRDLLWVEEEGGMHNESTWGRRLDRALPFLIGP